MKRQCLLHLTENHSSDCLQEVRGDRVGERKKGREERENGKRETYIKRELRRGEKRK